METTLPAPSPSLTSPADRDYTVKDLADRLQVSARHVWRMIDAGAVPGIIRFGRVVRLHKPTVDTWLAAGCPSPRRAGK